MMKKLFILCLTALLLSGCGRSLISSETIREGFIDQVISFHPGTAGSSLQLALATANIMRFTNEQNLAGVDCKKSFETAWNELDDEEKEYFRDNFESISAMIMEVLSDYSAVSAIFEDAGAAEAIQTVLQERDQTRKNWVSLSTAVSDVLSRS